MEKEIYVAQVVTMERFGRNFAAFEEQVVLKAENRIEACEKVITFLKEKEKRFSGFYILDCEILPVFEFPLWILGASQRIS